MLQGPRSKHLADYSQRCCSNVCNSWLILFFLPRGAVVAQYILWFRSVCPFIRLSLSIHPHWDDQYAPLSKISSGSGCLYNLTNFFLIRYLFILQISCKPARYLLRKDILSTNKQRGRKHDLCQFLFVAPYMSYNRSHLQQCIIFHVSYPAVFCDMVRGCM